jgi:tetratricopeptide (TPR) repeat protein
LDFREVVSFDKKKISLAAYKKDFVFLRKSLIPNTMQLNELGLLAQNLISYVQQTNVQDMTGVLAGGVLGNRIDALRGMAGNKLWQTGKNWYQQRVADLDVPVNATLQRSIRRSYLNSLVQTCDQSIAFIRTLDSGGDSVYTQRTRLQTLYHKLQRTLPTFCSFPLSDTDYQIRLIEIIRETLLNEIEGVATQETLPDNPADAVFDQLVLWDYTHELNEQQLLLQDEVHRFVLGELRTLRGLEVPEALEALLRLGWMHNGQHQTFFELMCRNFSEEIKHIEGVSEIFNAKLLAMLKEQMAEVLKRVEATQAGVARVEDRLTTLPEEVADQVAVRLSAINFDVYETHRRLTTQLREINEAFGETTQKKEKHEQKLAAVEDEEIRELLTDTLQSLDAKLLELDSKRGQLQKELTQFEDSVRSLALSLYSSPTSDSPRLLEARRLFELGDLVGANRVLNPDELERDKALIEKAEAFLDQKKQSLDQKKQSLAQEYLTKAKLIALDKSGPNWFSEASYYYTEAVAIYASYDTCFSVAYYLAEHNQHSQATRYYELMLNHATNDAQKATTLNNLANLHAATQQLARAEQEYTEALDLYRTLAAGNPQAYLPYVATTLNNLGLLHAATQQLARAEQEYTEALDIRRTLAAGNPQAYLPDVAMTLNNLGLLHAATQQLARAEQEYTEALDIYRTLAAGNPQAHLPYVATTLNNLAVLHQNTQQLARAEQEYTEALDLYRTLAAGNPQAYLPYVATTLNNLAVLHKNTQQLARAEQEYTEALDLYRTLAAGNPQAHLPYVATTLNNLAVLHQNTQQLARAEQEYTEALDIYRTLAEENPSAFQLDLARTLINMGLFYQDTVPDQEKSLGYSLEALINSVPYLSEVPLAQQICTTAINIWQAWGKDLMQYLKENQGEA